MVRNSFGGGQRKRPYSAKLEAANYTYHPNRSDRSVEARETTRTTIAYIGFLVVYV